MVILAQTASLFAEDYDDVDAYAIGQLGPQHARDAFARIDRPEIEVFVVPRGGVCYCNRLAYNVMYNSPW